MAELETLMVHVRFDGQSSRLPLAQLNLGSNLSDEAIKKALARCLDIAPARLIDYVVDRHENGNLTVRPEAIFG